MDMHAQCHNEEEQKTPPSRKSQSEKNVTSCESHDECFVPRISTLYGAQTRDSQDVKPQLLAENSSLPNDALHAHNARGHRSSSVLRSRVSIDQSATAPIVPTVVQRDSSSRELVASTGINFTCPLHRGPWALGRYTWTGTKRAQNQNHWTQATGRLKA